MTVIDEIAAERRRQIEVEGWTPEHDRQHTPGELLNAALCYRIVAQAGMFLPPGQSEILVNHGIYQRTAPPPSWRWDRKWWKPKNPRRDLIRAGALALAEKEAAVSRGQIDIAQTAREEYALIVGMIECLDHGKATNHPQSGKEI